MRMSATFRAPRRAPLLQVAKSAIATIAAWLIAGWLIPGPVPVFGAIAALLVVQPSLNQSFSKAIERTVGVVIGVVVAAVLGLVLGSSSWVVIIAIAAALLLSWVLKMTPGSANQVAISAILVLALGTATPGYALDRVLETLLGATIGFIVNVAIVPPVAVGPAATAVAALGEELAGSLERLADALASPNTAAQREELLLTARLMRPMRDAAESAIAAASESLALNPRRTRNRTQLEDLQEVLDRFGPIVTQVIGMTRAYYDHYEDSISDDPAVRAIAEQLRRAAHDVRREVVAAGAEGPRHPDAPLEPALTTPLVVIAPPAHWILVGSLLEDLRRIHDALGE